MKKKKIDSIRFKIAPESKLNFQITCLGQGLDMSKVLNNFVQSYLKKHATTPVGIQSERGEPC
jgi:hypothetical protein